MAIGNFYFVPDTGTPVSVAVASAGENLNFAAAPSGVGATVNYTTESCNVRSTGSNK